MAAMLNLEQFVTKAPLLNRSAPPVFFVPPLLMNTHVQRIIGVQQEVLKLFLATQEKSAKPLEVSLSVKLVTIAQHQMALKSHVMQGHIAHLEAKNPSSAH